MVCTVVDPELRRILTLLASGLTDRAVAGQLHIGCRTIERRIGGLMTDLGVQSRFQLGIVAMHLGWITLEDLSSVT